MSATNVHQKTTRGSRKGAYGRTSKSTRTSPAGTKKAGKAKIIPNKLNRELPTLDKIHLLFLLYSGAHNLINAWHRAENVLFFVFVFVGILSVELMLYSIYTHWKDGRMVGRMLSVGKFAGAVAMFYATAGILAQAQTGNSSDWIMLYYQWILPTSAPVMFLFAFWIQSADPIMTAERDQIAYDHLISVEEKRINLDKKRIILLERKDLRRLESHIKKQKLLALWKESTSWRTRRKLKTSARNEFPMLLERIGVALPPHPGNVKPLPPQTHLKQVDLDDFKKAANAAKK